jgi:hypothetical protein
VQVLVFGDEVGLRVRGMLMGVLLRYVRAAMVCRVVLRSGFVEGCRELLFFSR